MTVPNFVGTNLVDANTAAEALGITLVPTGEPSDQPVGTILSQDVLVGTSVPVGSEVNVTVASGADTVPVPDAHRPHEGGGAPGDRRGRPRGRAAGPRPSTTSCARGSVVSQNPRPASSWRRARPSTTSCRRAPNRRPTPTPTPTPDPDPDTHADPDPPTPTPDADPDARRRQTPGRPRLGQAPGSSQRLQRGSSGRGPASASTRAWRPRRIRGAEQAFHRRAGARARAAGISGVTDGRRVRLPAGPDLVAAGAGAVADRARSSRAGRRPSDGSADRSRRRCWSDDRPSSGPSRPGGSRSADIATSACADGSCDVGRCRPGDAERRVGRTRYFAIVMTVDVLGRPELVARDQDGRAALAAVGALGDRSSRTTPGRSPFVVPSPVTVGCRGCSA